MYRLAIEQLIEWKYSNERKPLIVKGARQVGKTWLIKEFGKLHFQSIVYVNFETATRLQNLFEVDFDIDRIIVSLQTETSQIITENTLIVLDEIQEAKKGLTMLKYFYENAPHYYVIAAGSLLGIALQKEQSFPVGKVDFIQIYPMTFFEFLLSQNEDGLANHLKNTEWKIIDTFHEKYIYYLRMYYFLGGMPEVIKRYNKNKMLRDARKVQLSILKGYDNDFSKYAPIEIVPRIRLVWQSIINQLAKENKKFIYGQLKKGSRAKDFELAINWLIDAGLLYKVNLINKAQIPLAMYSQLDIFKLYLVDLGLLAAMAGIDAEILLEKNAIMEEFKGAFTEQFVFQQLISAHERKVYYWEAEQAKSSIDFLVQHKRNVIPIEVKAEENLKAKSLKVFCDTYNPRLAIRTSMSKYREESWMINVPLFCVLEYLNRL